MKLMEINIYVIIKNRNMTHLNVKFRYTTSNLEIICNRSQITTEKDEDINDFRFA